LNEKSVVTLPTAKSVIFPLPAHTLSKSYYAMDDANIPSLLSLPYLGWVSENDVTYQRTRRYLLSEWNPYFFQGSAAKGIGSPHTGIGWIWPMSIIMQATTSTNDKEITECLEFLQRTDADTEFMHESTVVFGKTILRNSREVGLPGPIRNLEISF